MNSGCSLGCFPRTWLCLCCPGTLSLSYLYNLFSVAHICNNPFQLLTREAEPELILKSKLLAAEPNDAKCALPTNMSPLFHLALGTEM